MPASIPPSIPPVRLPDLPGPARSPAGAGAPQQDFSAVLKDAVHKVESFHQAATREVEQLLNGESEDLHGAILSTQRADLAFELFTQVRNKVVQAYQEVMRMQV
jgi:flagellar hook-basal body complex protein FliE